MKKIIFVLLALIMMGNVSFAQDKAKTTTPQQKAATNVAAPTVKQKLKKDGTPDMRYKENKEKKDAAVKPAGPTKKDGTPDMRHNANKKAAVKPKN